MDLRESERINVVNDNIKLIESKESLTFGTDAYLLSAFIQGKGNARAVELGAGSGIISLLAFNRKKCQQVYEIEVQEAIADIAKRNVELNFPGNNISVICKDLRDVTVLDTGGEVDMVFSNPPYMKSSSGKLNGSESKTISRHEIFGDINDFCACAKRLLKFGGSFYVVYRPDRLADLIYALKSNNLEPKRLQFVHSNPDTPPSILLIQAKLGSKSGLIVEKPLYIYKSSSLEYTEQYKKIYEGNDI